ncbi:MAG: hypothetical protein Q8Q23_03540 [bacterium]|nr:hypothetical protein [bacterium]
MILSHADFMDFIRRSSNIVGYLGLSMPSKGVELEPDTPVNLSEVGLIIEGDSEIHLAQEVVKLSIERGKWAPKQHKIKVSTRRKKASDSKKFVTVIGINDLFDLMKIDFSRVILVEPMYFQWPMTLDDMIAKGDWEDIYDLGLQAA